MTKFWCKYTFGNGANETCSYQTLGGLLTDILTEMENSNSEIHSFTVWENKFDSEAITIIHPYCRKD